MKPKTSYIWAYFDETSCNEQVQCRICEKVYSRKGRGTTSLKNHLRALHPKQYDEFTKRNDLSKQTEPEKEQFTMEMENESDMDQIFVPIEEVTELYLEESTPIKTEQDVSDPRIILIDKLISEMIALQNLPSNFVKGLGFQRLINVISPSYHLKNHRFYSNNITDEIYPRMKAKIQELLLSIADLSLIIDVWSEPNAGVSFLTVTCHCITPAFERLAVMLQCEIIEDCHTGENIAQKCVNILMYWRIPPGKVHCIIHGAGASSRNIPQLPNYKNIGCIVHKLQLCLKTAVESQQHVTNLIEKCKKLATHFKRSVLAQEQLHAIQKDLMCKSPLTVVQECPRRWDSTLHMMERLLQLKDALMLYANKNTHTQHITPQEWPDVEKCVRILKPCQETIKTLNNSETSISSVIPLVYVLKTLLQEEHKKKYMNTTFKNVIETLISELNCRLSDAGNNNVFALATYLDPRFKLRFIDGITKKRIQRDILTYIRHVNADTNSPLIKRKRTNTTNYDIARASSSGAQNKVSGIQALLMEALETDSDDEDDANIDHKAAVLKAMLNEYNKTKRISTDEDPLEWWKENDDFQQFYKIARKYLSPPASAMVDQIFSGTGLVYDELSDRCESGKFCKLLFVKFNFHPLLKYDY